MAYDTPKAAHFVAFKNGSLMNSHESIDVRWEAANFLKDKGIDMMFFNKIEINDALADFNRGRDIQVLLRRGFIND